MIDSIWSEAPLDILVNNAAGNFIARTEELSPGAWNSVISIVLMGTLNCTMACGRRWLAAKHPGTVLSISATYAPVGSAYVVPSAVSKAGVEALTRSLAVEWGDRGIRMNAIAPGPIPTQGAFSRVLPHPGLEALALDRNPLHRFGTVEELANLAAFLVSDGSGYINGEVIRMDGGEFLQGAGEFSNLGRVLKEEDWQAIKPKKSVERVKWDTPGAKFAASISHSCWRASYLPAGRWSAPGSAGPADSATAAPRASRSSLWRQSSSTAFPVIWSRFPEKHPVNHDSPVTAI